MSFLVSRTQADICAAQLCDEINANITITTVCESVRIDNGTDVSIFFAASPSAPELTELDTVVLPNHVCDDDAVGSESDLEVQQEHITKLSDVNSINFDGYVNVFEDTSDPGSEREVTVDILGSDIEKDDVSVITDVNILNFEGNVSVVDETNGKVTIAVGGTNSLVGGLHQMTFLDDDSGVKEKWLGYYEDGIASSEINGIMPWKSKLVGITFSNRDTGIDQDVKIYSTPEGGGYTPKTLDFSWTLSNIRIARKTDFVTDIIFDVGDKIAVFLKDTGTDANRPVIKLYFQIIDGTTSSGSENNSGNFATGTGGGSS